MPITIFTRQSCAPCATLKYWLNKNNLVYKEISYEENPEAYPQAFRIFPLIQIGNEYVEGLNLKRLASILGA